MGNKSKQRSKPGKWKQVREMSKARQVRTWTSWQGLASPSLQAVTSKVGLSATNTERAHPMRQLHGPVAMPTIHSGGTLRRVKAEKLEINQQPQPWQKAAAKAKERVETKPHLDWNARRLAREERLTAQNTATLALLRAG